MADVASLVVRVKSDGAEQAAKGLDNLSKSADSADKSTTTLSKSAVAGSKAMETFAKTASVADKTSETFAKSAETGSKAASGFGSKAQQAGFQIQDMVVQLQSGTSAFVAIGQQVPQFLGAFGPIGAITGAVVALGSAIGGVLYKSMGDATVSAEELKEANKQLASVLEETDYGVVGLSESLLKLAQSNEVAARSQISLALVNTKVAADAASQAIGESADSFEDVSVQLVNLEKVTRQFGESSSEAFDQNLALTSQIENLSEEYGITNSQVLDLVKAQDAFNKQPTVENAQALATTMTSVTDSSSGANSEFIRLTAEVVKNAQIMIKAAGDAETLRQAQQNLKSSMDALSAATRSQNDELLESLRIQTLSGKEKILAQAEQNKREVEQSKTLSDEQKAIAKQHYDTMAQMQIKAINEREAARDARENQALAKQFERNAKADKSDKDRRAAEEERADKYLAKLEQDNMSELELIGVHEAEKKAVIDEYRKQGLIDKQEYEDAVSEIERTAIATRADLEADAMKKLEDANQQLFDKEMQIKKDKEDREQEVIDKGIEAHREMTGQLKTLLGENNDLYKAAALTQIAIDTQRAAVAAYMAGSAVPVAGIVLGPLAAGAAIAYGVAAAAKVAGAREQGGSMTAGSAYQMAERGKAEVIIPAGNSRAKTIGQMNEMMGGNSGGDIKQITIINNTSGRIDSASASVDEEGELRILIDEHVSAGLMNEDSPIAKARRQTRGAPGF